MARLLVIGGGAAGMTAASVAKRRDQGLEVTVVEAGSHISFSACGMPYWFGNVVPGGPDALVVVGVEEARAKRGLDVRVDTCAVAIDPENKTVEVQGPDGPENIGYDRLVLAHGAQPRIPFDLRGLGGVHALRHLDDGIRLKDEVAASPPQHAIVLGGGFIGLEMAEAFVERGIPVTLVHSRDTLLSNMLDADLGALVNEAVEAAGVDLVTGARAQGLVGNDHVEGVDLGDRTVEGDLVVMGLGLAPDATLAEAAGCQTEDDGSVVVGPDLRTTSPDVWACGDNVRVVHKVTGRPLLIPLALHANRMGRIVGANATGGNETMPGVLGSSVTRFFDLEAAATGLTEAAALRAGLDVVARTIEGGTRAHYFPGSQKLQARLVVERGSLRVVGAQIVGGRGAGKRIDAMAAAITMGATAPDVEAMDFAYAPPFNAVWDPWAIAARLAGRDAQD